MELLKFLDDAITPWHTAESVSRELLNAGFAELKETESWTLQKGKAYFVKRGAAVFAFRMPSRWTSKTRFRLASSHTDFPALKIAPNPDRISAGVRLLHPEVYGGALLNTWFDRDLGIAGIVIVENGGFLRQKLVRLKTLCRIPELAIHLNRNVNEDGFRVNPQTQLDACFSSEESRKFIPCLEEEVGGKFVDFELQFFDAQPAALGGLSQEWIYSGRLDNLLSCDAILCGIVENTVKAENVRGAFFFNSEEIGSETRDGAAGNFAEAMLLRIADSVQMNRGELLGNLSDSILFSLDVAHALHPAYAEKMEPNHSPVLGRGIVLKTNAKKRYASEALSNALLKRICETRKIPLQTFVSRNDMPCGSTVGPRLSASLGIPTVDLGEAILSMHSVREMAAVEDHERMRNVMREFFL